MVPGPCTCPQPTFPTEGGPPSLAHRWGAPTCQETGAQQGVFLRELAGAAAAYTWAIPPRVTSFPLRKHQFSCLVLAEEGCPPLATDPQPACFTDSETHLAVPPPFRLSTFLGVKSLKRSEFKGKELHTRS